MIFSSLTRLHVDKIVELQNSCFPDGWSKQNLISGIENGGLQGVVLFDGDDLLGFITYSKTCDFIEIDDVLVAPSHRKKGYATLLIEKMLEGLDKGIQKAFLEVRESNIPAISLYKKSGFSVISTRKKYYSDGENALVMQKELS